VPVASKGDFAPPQAPLAWAVLSSDTNLLWGHSMHCKSVQLVSGDLRPTPQNVPIQKSNPFGTIFAT
jgi:hypothetical protein